MRSRLTEQALRAGLPRQNPARAKQGGEPVPRGSSASFADKLPDVQGASAALRRLLTLLVASCAIWLPGLAFAQDAAMTVDERISAAILPIVTPIVSTVFFSVPVFGVDFPLIVGWLIVAATIFTLYFGFIQIRGFAHAISIVKGDYLDPDDTGDVTPFQALATALSGTVGLGNIAGVGVAVYLGGPGATFWMILAGLLGMASKFTECMLGVHYRTINPDGSISGGPMYYLSKGLGEQNRAALGKFLAVFFSICCIGGALGGGNMFQANQSFAQMAGIFPAIADSGWIFGLVMAAIVGVVIIGGIRSIAKVTEKIVPGMAVIYVGAALTIILVNYDQVGAAFNAIIEGAFAPTAVAGGVVGALIQGFKRAAFSNEAGIGSAAIAHSAVQTKHPATEGYVSLLEPFIDTVVICTMTSLVITITGVWEPGNDVSGIELTSAAFASDIPFFSYVLAVAAILFAFSTMLSWSYYGMKAWTYLVGEGAVKEMVFKVIFLVFIVIGASMSLGPVIDFSDAMIFAMSLGNIVGLYFLMPKVKALLKDYTAKRRSGEIRKYGT